MKNISKRIKDLTHDPRNARVHPPEQLARLAGSIKEFGFLAPVLITKEDQIIAGHGRVEAARTAGLEEVPCIQVEHLSEAQQRAYVLADNRLAQMAEWDMEMVASEIKGLQELDFDTDFTGFSQAEVDEALRGVGEVDLGEGPKTMQEAAEEYEDSDFRQIILIYGVEEFDRVVEAMGEYAEQNGLTDNCEVLNHLLETNGHAISGRESSED